MAALPGAIAEGLPTPPDALASTAAQFRQQQAIFGALVIRDVISLWAQLDTTQIRASWPAMQKIIASLALDRFGMAAFAGAQFYDRMRNLSLGTSAAGAAGAAGYVAVVPVVPEVLAIKKILDITGPYALLGRIRGGQPLQIAMNNTAVEVSGVVARFALSAARQAVADNVKADPKALAWMRVLGPRPCGFCAMLASRGPVYKTAQTAGFKAHNHCMCSAAPAFSRADIAQLKNNELYDLWKQVTKGFSGKGAINAWRRYWDKRDEGASGLEEAA